MSGWTNKGKAEVLKRAFQGTAAPANHYVALVTSAVVPTADTNTLDELTEIAAGNGYSRIALPASTSGWDTVSPEDDANDYGFLQAVDVVWTATGGSLPASGDGARYAVLLSSDSPTGEVMAWWDLASDQSISDTQTLTLQDCEVRIS